MPKPSPIFMIITIIILPIIVFLIKRIQKEMYKKHREYTLSQSVKMYRAYTKRGEVAGDRKMILLKACRDLLEKQYQSQYVMNLLSETVFYDDAECDGYCLLYDIKAELQDVLEDAVKE